MKLTLLVIFQLMIFVAISQPLTEISLSEKFRQYSASSMQEKLFLHTDKEFYVAGEIIWFKIYYTDAASGKPMQLSKVAYVEILNSNNEPVLQAKIQLEPGKGKGSFYVPASLNSGYYTIRAYTNWMKNFDADFFFEKQITIVNTLKIPEPASITDSSLVSINFFPEGGNLVNDINSKIGFNVSGKQGAVYDFTGYVINQNNDTVTSFAPLKFGIGHFYFTPATGYTYKAVVTLPDGSVHSQALPLAYDQGYIMNVMVNGEQEIKVTVRSKRLPTGQPVEQVVLAAHSRQVLKTAEKGFLNNADSIVFFIDPKRLGKGITYLTLFNGAGKPVCERLVYIKPQAGTTLNVKADRDSYGNRQKISLVVNASGSGENSLPLDMSVSVYYLDTLQKAEQLRISDYMWLTSELAGTVESPGYYFSDDPAVDIAIDNLMLTHGWRKFRWDDILESNNSFIRYFPELNGLLVPGRIIDSRNDSPVPYANAYLSIPGRPFRFHTAQSDQNGNLHFEVKDYFGNGQVIAQPGLNVDSFYRVEIQKPYAEVMARKRYSSFMLTEEVRQQLLEKSIGMQVQNIYRGDSLRNFQEPFLADTLPFYGLPEARYNLDDFKRFTTMEEVLREYVREVGVGLRNGGLVFRIFNPAAHDFYESNSLVLLDGVALADPNKIFTYDPLKIKKLEIIRSRYILGQSIFHGVASFSTYEPGFSAYELDPRLVAIDYSGLQLQREFYSPVYETKEQIEKRIPDFRNTLLWEPDLVTGKDGTAALQFYSGDRKGTYRVVIQGMSADGDFVSVDANIEVK